MPSKSYSITAVNQNAPADVPMIGAEGVNTIVGVHITGTFVMTLEFQVTINGTDWVAKGAVPANEGAAVTTATAPGIFRVDARGVKGVRVRSTAFTSGTATVVFEPTVA